MLGRLLSLIPGGIPTILVAALVLGFGGGVAFEHRPPMPFPLSLLGQGLKTQRDALRASIDGPKGYVVQLRDLAADRDSKLKGFNECEDLRKDARDDAAGQITKDSTAADASRSGAYDIGFTAGRAAGRRQCASTSNVHPNADLPAVRPAGAGGAGELRNDLRDAWSAAAYNPGPPVLRGVDLPK